MTECKDSMLSRLEKHEADDFYHIYEYNGIKYIQIEGYFYLSEDYGDGPWRFESYSYFDLPLSEFIEKMKDDNWYDIHQEGLKHYVQDMTEKEAVEEFGRFIEKDYKILPYTQLTMETKCGNYLDG